jgi:DNA-binding CsgD family transcriptional regulator
MKAVISSLLWKKILDYLAEAGRERDIDKFCYKALIGLEKLVNADGSVLQMVGPGRTLLPTSKAHNYSEKALRRYRRFYYRFDPGRALFPEGITVAAAKWRDFKENALITDFLEANDIRASGGVFLYDYRGNLYAFLNVHKKSNRGFSERETAVMEIVQPHLSNLLANLTAPSPLKPETVTILESIQGNKILSRRETEITGYLHRRFSAAEIAETLQISRRTVERHIEHIYGKLGVHNKQDLIRLLPARITAP